MSVVRADGNPSTTAGPIACSFDQRSGRFDYRHGPTAPAPGPLRAPRLGSLKGVPPSGVGTIRDRPRAEGLAIVTDGLRIAGCTITSVSRIPESRLLETSFRRHHPTSPFFTVTVDNDWYVIAQRSQDPSNPVLQDASVGLLTLQSLRADEALPRDVLFQWDELGSIRLATPLVVARLLEARDDVDVLIVLAPWMEVHGALDALARSASEVGWAVVPKRLRAIESSEETSKTHLGLTIGGLAEGVIETDLLVDGVLSWDVLAFARSGGSALDWLHDRMAKATQDGELSAMTLQHGGPLDRWLDVAASIFPTALCSEPGQNVGPWNLDERPLRQQGPLLACADGPLLTTNHRDHDASSPWLLKGPDGRRSPGRLSANTLAAALWKDRTERLQAEQRSFTGPRWFEGSRITHQIPFTSKSRRLVRLDAVADAADVTSPFARADGVPSERLAWLRDAVTVHGHPSGTVEWEAIKTLSASLPVTSRSGDIALGESGLPERRPITPGVDIVGHLRSMSGLGTAGRRIVEALRGSDVPVSAIDLPMSLNRSRLDFPVENELRHPVMIAAMNGDVMAATRRAVGRRAFDRRYVIGQWAWETEDLPLSHQRGFPYVQEIWAYSTYVADVLRRYAPEHVPVAVVPPALERPSPDPTVGRHDFGLDERLMFLFIFDYTSTISRKNPIGLIDAYREAFTEKAGAQLVLKSINANIKPDDAERVRLAASGRSDIVLLDGFLPRPAGDALLAACDVYVSLHRSEGLGLTMAEAMLLGKPVVATGYGGNLDFMSPQSALIVASPRTTAESDDPPYLAGTTWSEPDLAAAAEGLRCIADSQPLRHTMGARGESTASSWFSVDRVRELMVDRIDRVGGVR